MVNHRPASNDHHPKSSRFLPLGIYVVVGFAIGVVACNDYASASIISHKNVIVEITEKGERVGHLAKMISTTFLWGTAIFILGWLLVHHKRNRLVVATLLSILTVLAGIVFYFDAEMIKAAVAP